MGQGLRGRGRFSMVKRAGQELEPVRQGAAELQYGNVR